MTSLTQLYLLDFGASREYPKKFADNFLRVSYKTDLPTDTLSHTNAPRQVVHGAATHDRDEILRSSKDLGFLTGYESKVWVLLLENDLDTQH